MILWQILVPLVKQSIKNDKKIKLYGLWIKMIYETNRLNLFKCKTTNKFHW